VTVQDWATALACEETLTLERQHQHDSSCKSDAELNECTTSRTAARSSSEVLTKLLTKCPFEAFYFETPPVTRTTIHNQRMEFVLVDAPRLYNFADISKKPNSKAFQEYFHSSDCKGDSSCAFDSKGKDAFLISPKPIPSTASGENSDSQCYGHLAAFVRKGPPQQVAETWRHVAQEYIHRVNKQNEKPVWLSTSGLGVAWLHFRLDKRPKYYSYPPYKKVTAQSYIAGESGKIKEIPMLALPQP